MLRELRGITEVYIPTQINNLFLIYTPAVIRHTAMFEQTVDIMTIEDFRRSVQRKILIFHKLKKRKIKNAAKSDIRRLKITYYPDKAIYPPKQ